MLASGRRLTLGLAAAVLGAGLGGAGPVAQPEPPSEPAGGQVKQAGAVPLATATPSPRNANYTIDVTLDHDARTLTGREVLTWRNISPVTTSELRFHLYYNAWRNTRSTWMRERALGRGFALHGRAESAWGWIDVTRVRRLGAGDAMPIDLTPGMAFIAPDDGNADDRTVLAVPLRDPVAPGETVTVEVEWTSRVPRTFARTGRIGNYYFMAHWFPKVGVLEPEGWNCHQFHAATEFYADYGLYDVRLTVPTGWVLGATGREQGITDNGDGTSTHQYYAEDVHDFAWTTSPDFLDLDARFEHPELPDVDIRLLLQPEHAGQADRHVAATQATLKYFGEWFGAYPYDHVTVVDPAWQSGSGGMEYPTLLTAGSRWLAPRSVDTPEAVTVHEAGHQFFYGVVGNNEFEHAWLDEGLNTFATARALDEFFKPSQVSTRLFGGFIPWVFDDIAWSRATDGNRWAGYRRNARMDAQATPTYRYWPGTAGSITYNKTALWLHTLERHLGWPTLQGAMAAYYDTWRFRHPSPQAFFDAVSDAAGTDLRWFFDQVHGTTAVFDYGIAELTTRDAAPRGFFDGNGRPVFAADAPVAASRSETTVVVRRYGDGIFPVDVVVEFADGHVEREHWNGRAQWTAYRYVRDARVTSAIVDPDRVLLLDVDFTNNSRTMAPQAAAAATKWSLKWIVWLQDVLMMYAFFV